MNFCLRAASTNGPTAVDLARFSKDAFTRMYFAGNTRPMPKLFIRSNWEAPAHELPPDFRTRVANFCSVLADHFHSRKQSSPNLLPSQTAALNFLKLSNVLIVCKSDKNLGPVVLERDEYVRRALDEHLHTNTYRPMSPDAATSYIERTREAVLNFMKIYLDPRSDDWTFLSRSLQVKDPFSYFYLLAKIHKAPWKTRPIVSVSGSLLHGLGKWIDFHLQTLCNNLPFVYRSSTAVVTRLKALPILPPDTRLFTMDAQSMYTNIDTPTALTALRKFFATSPYCYYMEPKLQESLLAGLHIIMNRNLFRFGDSHWLQLKGTAMGTPPAPMYATVFFAIFEIELIPKFSANLLEYGRYIDDGFGVWQRRPGDSVARNQQRWTAFQHAIQIAGSPYPAKRLVWDFSPLQAKVDFLDLTISFDQGRVVTCLYEKALNLYLYLPPHSAHPPGVLKGLIVGRIKQIRHLTSRLEDQSQQVTRMFHRLLARGHTHHAIRPIFDSALADLQRPRTRAAGPSPLFLHVEFHPHDVSSQQIQQTYKSTMLRLPPTAPTPSALVVYNHMNAPLDISRLIVAYSRPRNLGNILAPRRFRVPPGMSVSNWQFGTVTDTPNPLSSLLSEQINPIGANSNSIFE